MASMPLRLPNRSVEAAFRQEVWEYFQNKVDNAFVNDFMSALWAEEEKRAEAAICQILEATLSFYHEYREYSYHLILDGFFTGKGYRVISELETGYGRSDLIILDPARNRALLLELKHEQQEETMTTALTEAKSQILQKKYESFLVYHNYTTCLSYGLAFSGKKALIAKT
jgi:hypothetical protein